MSRRKRRFPGVWIVAVPWMLGATLLAGDPPRSQDKPAEKAKQQPASSVFEAATRNADRAASSEVKVYTNADLQSVSAGRASATRPEAAEPAAGDASTPATGAEAAKPEDPLDWLTQRQTAQQERQQRIAAAQAELDRARERLKQLETQLLATRNPYSPRPQISDDEKVHRQTSGETAAQRHERTRQLVEEAREHVREAERALARARAGS